MSKTLFETEEKQVSAESDEKLVQKSSSGELEGRYRISPLTLSVFRRETENGVFRNFQLQRAFTRDDGESFDYTSSLRPRDLRKASRLLELAADDIEGLEKAGE